MLGWSLADTRLLARDVVNPGGWPVAARFLAGAAAPDLTADYLAEVSHGVLVTLAYAVLGPIVSVLAGLLGAVLVSRRWWRGPGAWLAMRVGPAVPRGLHEALWGLLLVTILGPDPLAAVLAIAIPYAAITAKVYADLLDEAPAGPYEALRAAGAGRVTAFCYALLPYCAADMLSYALYRFDCAIRSAVILGIVGAGGIGLLLDNAFQDLSYGRMWTSIYALLLVCAAGDQASRRLRDRLTTRADTRPMWTAVGVAATAAFRRGVVSADRPGRGVLGAGTGRGGVPSWRRVATRAARRRAVHLGRRERGNPADVGTGPRPRRRAGDRGGTADRRRPRIACPGPAARGGARRAPHRPGRTSAGVGPAPAVHVASRAVAGRWLSPPTTSASWAG